MHLEEAQTWSDDSLLAVVQALLNLGAEVVTDSEDDDCTVSWVEERLGDTSRAGHSAVACSRLLALLMSHHKDDEEECDWLDEPSSSSLSSCSNAHWGNMPAEDVRRVLRHVLRNYSKEQQCVIASFHPDCATAMLAVAAG